MCVPQRYSYRFELQRAADGAKFPGGPIADAFLQPAREQAIFLAMRRGFADADEDHLRELPIVMATNDDGHLDLVYAEPVTRRRVLSLLPKLIKGTHIEEADIHWAEVEVFELIADAPVPSHLDGEAQALQTEFRVRILRDALRVV